MLDFYAKALLVFFAAGLTDAVWTLYIRHTSMGNVWRATIYSSAIVFMGAFVTVEYVNDKRLVFAAALGGGLGTYILLKREKMAQKTTEAAAE